MAARTILCAYGVRPLVIWQTLLDPGADSVGQSEAWRQLGYGVWAKKDLAAFGSLEPVTILAL